MKQFVGFALAVVVTLAAAVVALVIRREAQMYDAWECACASAEDQP